jgi:predicted porin
MRIARLVQLLLVSVLAQSAQAQTREVFIYGVVDLAVRLANGLREFIASDGSVTSVTSGVSSTSRIGFRGDEDLGGGLRASFQLESGVSADTGANGNAAKFFDGQSWVGLQWQWGIASLGRQTSLLADAIGPIDPLGLRLPSFNPNMNVAALSQHRLNDQFGPTGSTTGSYRLDNAFKYNGRFDDLTVRAMYAAGEQTHSALLDACGAGVVYEAGDLVLSGAYMHFRDSSGLSLGAWLAGGAVYVGPVRVKVTFGENKAEASEVSTTRNRTIGVGVSMLIAETTELTLARYVVERARTGSADDGFRRTVGFVEYLLSKRSKLYVEVDATRWQGNYQAPVSEVHATGFSLGLAHSF